MRNVWVPATVAVAIVFAACRRGGSEGATAARVSPRYVRHDSASGDYATNVYASTASTDLAPLAARAEPLVYVPNSRSNSVSIIDPATRKVVRTIPTGKLPQHVVPSYDLTTLWIANNNGNSLTPIDPSTGEAGTPVGVDDPYNLYFTPNGNTALVIAEGRHRFDARDARTMRLIKSVRVDCGGLDHLDFTADDAYAIATCEFSGQLVKLDLAKQAPIGYLKLKAPAMPQDIRSSPDGKVFYVADMMANGVRLIDPFAFKEIGFIKTGKGAHGIVVGHGGVPFYITNRGWNTIYGRPRGPGSISVVDPQTRSVVATWSIPNGGSPDMGNVSPDGKQLWVSGRYDSEVYVFDTDSGELLDRIRVGREPHGLCVWPQPGRFSLGHTGNMR